MRWMRSPGRERKWTEGKPHGDSRKVPGRALELCWLMVLRVAFFMQFFAIPAALVGYTDQTGMHFVQHKGAGWLPREMATEDAKVQGFGDMRQ